MPKEIANFFLPDLERLSAQHYTANCSLAEDDLQPRGCWEVAGIQLISRTLSAHEIRVAITVRPQRLPNGLSILAMSPLWRRNSKTTVG